MASLFQIWMDGSPASDEFYERLISLEVEESADTQGALRMQLPVSRSDTGELTAIDDLGLQPHSRLAVSVGLDGPAQVIFDGYVLGHKLHLESALAESTLEVYGQDASWLMNLEEKTKLWPPNVTDGIVANQVFADHGITPDPSNLDDDSGAYTEDAHTLMQRGTDLEFLKRLARRGGRLLRVTGGPVPGSPVGVFARPGTDTEASTTIRLNDPDAPTLTRLDIEWDVMRPTAVTARQASLKDKSGMQLKGDTADSGLTALDQRDLASFAGKKMSVILSAPADDSDQLSRRAQALLREAGWFVRCSGEADAAALGTVLRAGDTVALDGVGATHSGKYFVWRVLHRIDQDSHRMNFVLVRNAVGGGQGGGSNLLAGLL